MNQHDEQHGDQQGGSPPDASATVTGDVGATGDAPSPSPAEPSPAPAEEDRLEAKHDLAEHEAAVPSSTEDAPHEPSGNTSTTPLTGDDRVDQALSRLAELDRLDVTEHAGVVENVHRALQDTLAEEED